MNYRLFIISLLLTASQLGISQTALDFNESNKVVLLSPTYSLPSSYTLEARFKSPLPSNQYCTLFRGLNYNHPILTSDNILGAYDNLINTLGEFRSTGFDMTILNEGWHHIAAVCSGGVTTFYLDGENVGSVEFQSLLTIYAIGNYQGGEQNFGSVDDVRIWNYARSAAEIQDDMNICLTGSEFGLDALYDFEEGSGTELTDITGNGYNGTLTNMDTMTDWIPGYECSPVGIDSFEDKWTLSIYPNPTHEHLTIENPDQWSSLELRILNATGQIVFAKDLDDDLSTVIDISSITPGSYVLQLSNSEGWLSRKLIIE